MIDRKHDLSTVRQAELLGISSGSVYCLPRPVSDADLALMRRIDELHLVHPFMGAHMLRDQLERQGLLASRRHVASSWAAWALRRWRRSQIPASVCRGTRSTRTFCSSWRSCVPVMFERWTRPPSRWRARVLIIAMSSPSQPMITLAHNGPHPFRSPLF